MAKYLILIYNAQVDYFLSVMAFGGEATGFPPRDRLNQRLALRAKIQLLSKTASTLEEPSLAISGTSRAGKAPACLAETRVIEAFPFPTPFLKALNNHTCSSLHVQRLSKDSYNYILGIRRSASASASMLEFGSVCLSVEKRGLA